jgi:hypothetical protein
LTLAPLPSWLDLLRLLVCRPASDTALAAAWCRTGELAGWLSRSAWSLALIASWREGRRPRHPVTVWIPDFFCNSSLTPLRATGARLVFYPLTDKLAPDISACRALTNDSAPDIFLLVHYFGQPTDAVATIDFCSRHGAWLIEDAAHVLRPTSSIGTDGDFVLYSPHKHLPIPEGAVLVVRSGGPGRLGAAELSSFGTPATWAGQLGDLRRRLGCSIARGRIRTAIWLGKRVLQKLGLRRLGRQVSPFVEQEQLAEADISQLGAPAHGGVARRLLTGLTADIGVIARQRERHQLQWDALVLTDDASASAGIATTERPSHREWTPYLAGYRVDAANAAKTYADWQRQGLPVTTWPDLPPEVIANPGRHASAWNLRHSRLYLPVHQSLQALELARVFDAPGPAAENKARVRFTWDMATRPQWQQWLAQSGRSSLLQSWAYGAAKSSTSAWRVRRCAIYCDNEPIALAQVLERRVAGVRINRINRGPLHLRALSADEQHAVWQELARLGCLRRARVLSVAPEEVVTGSSLVLFAKQGLRQFTPIAWESAWVDLGLDLGALRKRLDGKWRNMLSFAERAALELEIGSDDQLFDWMIVKYRENMQQKKFRGPAIGLLRSLRHHLEPDSQPLVLRALSGGEAVAGICIVPHGAAATYLLGWNGPVGRQLKANQYLLWQAIAYLKQRGLRWFDLGGFNELRDPGVAAFKLGLNGERYELVGEFWKW